jgi:hypothetical protein
MTALIRGRRLVESRLVDLEERIATGDENAWPSYLDTLRAAAELDERFRTRGTLLTTAEMAETLAIKPKSLLRRKSRGQATPALQNGKLIRWRA